MDRDKIKKQAKILRDKKMARIAKVAQDLRPKIESGVVKYNRPRPAEMKQFIVPPVPVRVSRSVSPPTPPSPQKLEIKQQQIDPTKVTQVKRGCASCRRKK